MADTTYGHFYRKADRFSGVVSHQCDIVVNGVISCGLRLPQDKREQILAKFRERGIEPVNGAPDGLPFEAGADIQPLPEHEFKAVIEALSGK